MLIHFHGLFHLPSHEEAIFVSTQMHSGYKICFLLPVTFWLDKHVTFEGGGGYIPIVIYLHLRFFYTLTEKHPWNKISL